LTQIAQVQRSERHDPIVVDLSLDRRGRLPHLMQQLRVRDMEQTGGLIRRQRLNRKGLLQNVPDASRVADPVSRQRPLDRDLVDEVPAVIEVLLDLLELDPVFDPTAMLGGRFSVSDSCCHVYCLSMGGIGKRSLPMVCPSAIGKAFDLAAATRLNMTW
jgi:hypothetical protein